MKYILFICMRNSGRSQMAQAIFNFYKKEFSIVDMNYEAISAGINPFSRVSSTCSKVMERIGIDMSDRKEYFPKKVEKEVFEGAAIVICLDRGISSSDLYGYTSYITWDVEDTRDKPEETVIRIREDLRTRCYDLFKNLSEMELSAATL